MFRKAFWQSLTRADASSLGWDDDSLDGVYVFFCLTQSATEVGLEPTQQIEAKHKADEPSRIKEIIEIRVVEGKRVKFTHRYRVLEVCRAASFVLHQVTRKCVEISKRVLARRAWRKFGACNGQPKGPEANVTYAAHNEWIDLSNLKPKRREDSDQVAMFLKMS